MELALATVHEITYPDDGKAIEPPCGESLSDEQALNNMYIAWYSACEGAVAYGGATLIKKAVANLLIVQKNTPLSGRERLAENLRKAGSKVCTLEPWINKEIDRWVAGTELEHFRSDARGLKRAAEDVRSVRSVRSVAQKNPELDAARTRMQSIQRSQGARADASRGYPRD